MWTHIVYIIICRGICHETLYGIAQFVPWHLNAAPQRVADHLDAKQQHAVFRLMSLSFLSVFLRYSPPCRNNAFGPLCTRCRSLFRHFIAVLFVITSPPNETKEQEMSGAISETRDDRLTILVIAERRYATAFSNIPVSGLWQRYFSRINSLIHLSCILFKTVNTEKMLYTCNIVKVLSNIHSWVYPQ